MAAFSVVPWYKEPSWRQTTRGQPDNLQLLTALPGRGSCGINACFNQYVSQVWDEKGHWARQTQCPPPEREWLYRPLSKLSFMLCADKAPSNQWTEAVAFLQSIPDGVAKNYLGVQVDKSSSHSNVLIVLIVDRHSSTEFSNSSSPSNSRSTGS